ncbi:MAG: hypothetical protein WAX66_04470 [Patescibacteria group bacterium]
MVKDNLQITFSKFYKEFKLFKKEFILLKDDMKGVKTNVLEVKEILSQHTLALLNIENINQVYRDMYQINREDIKKLDSRTAILENK